MTDDNLRRSGGSRIDGDQDKRGRLRHSARAAKLLEQFLRRDRDAIHDLGRPIKDLKDFIAQRAAKFAGTAASRGQFDPPVTRITLRADDVTFSHGLTMRDGDDCSKTVRSKTVCSKTVRSKTVITKTTSPRDPAQDNQREAMRQRQFAKRTAMELCSHSENAEGENCRPCPREAAALAAKSAAEARRHVFADTGGAIRAESIHPRRERERQA